MQTITDEGVVELKIGVVRDNENPADNPTQPKDGFTYEAVGNRLTSLETSGSWLYTRKTKSLAMRMQLIFMIKTEI